jgi:hypothetical protein
MADFSTNEPPSDTVPGDPSSSVGVLFGAQHLRASLHRGGSEPTDRAPRGAQRRLFGAFKGEFVIGPDFYEPLTDEELDELGVP